MKTALPGLNVRLATVIGVLLGIGAYKVVSKIIDKILIAMFDLEPLTPFDKNYLNDSPEYNMNMLACVKMTKFKYEKMKEFFYENYCMKHRRARSRLVTFFGRYFFKEIPKKEFDAMVDKILVKCPEPIRTEQDLMDWAKRF